ncbi:isochorismatase family protein [Nitratireductor sp. CAU 1489]|uniref:Isochorismatase family protein n=1 Tax=Nitratireductor arenosus TaxID=2682096 RepID=A0A844QGI5_9HYPH|nr:cysteine hydrolase family protein [Nitratireductor arenosus]MVA98502.1 isochorismatase family protein [Nitratireductor arenosus]
MAAPGKEAALILIDVQKAFVEMEAAGHRRNNPQAVANMARLLDAFRNQGLAVFHIRHASTEPGSLLRPERSGFEAIGETRERPGEAVLVKHVNSAFIGTDLEQQLRDGRHETVILAGITTNHCVETTTRMAGNLGFDARLVDDACYTFDRVGRSGEVESAEAIHAMTLSNLDGEFATIETTETVLAALRHSAAA